MNDQPRLQELLQSIEHAYGSLEQPQFAFQEERYKALLRHPFIADLMLCYFVKNDTDLNDDASLHLRVLHNDGSMRICLSFVDHWAMLFRYDGSGSLYEVVIDTLLSALLPAEREVMQLLNQHGFSLVTKEEAAASIEMNLFNTDRENARMYHALFSDDGVVHDALLK